MKLRHYLLLGIAGLLTGALIAQAQVPGVNSSLNTVFTMAFDNSTMKPTYASSASFVPPASATDICTITGSATKIVKVRRIIVGGVADAVQTHPVLVIKRSVANSAGTATTPTVVPYDSAFPAGSAVVRAYTANPTLGAAVGTVATSMVSFGNLTTGAVSPPTTEFRFGQLGSPGVLRGVAQVLAVNLGAVTYTTPVATCTVEWTEE